MNDFTHLAQQQNALLRAIFTTNNIAAQAIKTTTSGIIYTKNRGLQVYQANAGASALRSLQAAYPVIAQLIGEEAFGHLARDFWEQHPPKHGDLAQWGDELSGLINRIPALQTEPYLADIARAEWALHTAATAAEQAADFASFSLLTEYDPAALTLQLAAGTAVITSNYPIASILTAHLYNQPSFTEVGNLLRHTVAQHALVWRAGLRPMVASCSAGEAAFVSQLQHGDSLLAALDSLPLNNSHNFDLNTWLPHAVQTGLLLGVRSH